MRQPLATEIASRSLGPGLAEIRVICVLTGLLISLPLELFSAFRYVVRPVVFSLIVGIPLAWSATGSPSYIANPFTRWLWFMRWLAVMVYLLAHLFYAELSAGAGVAFLAYLLFSFFYEAGYGLASKGMWQTVLRVHVWAVSFICFILLVATLFWSLTSGANIFRASYSHITEIRKYLPTWPNYFAISLGLVTGLIVYFGHVNRRYFMLLAIVGPVMLLTMSRTGAILLTALFVIWLARSKYRNAWFQVVVFLAVIAIGVVVNLVKPLTAEMAGGRTLERAYYARAGRWEAALNVWKERPLLGYGFESFTDLVTEVYFLDRIVEVVGSSHNDYVDLLVRAGLVYSLVFWGWIAGLVLSGGRTSASIRPPSLPPRFPVVYLQATARGQSGSIPPLGKLRFPFGSSAIPREKPIRGRTFASRTLASLLFALLACAFVHNTFKTPEILAVFWYCSGVIAYLRRAGCSQGPVPRPALVVSPRGRG